MNLPPNKHPRRAVTYGKRCADGWRRTSAPNMRRALERITAELLALVGSSPAEVAGDAYGVILIQDAQRAIGVAAVSIERLWNSYAVTHTPALKPGKARAVPKRAKTPNARKARP